MEERMPTGADTLEAEKSQAETGFITKKMKGREALLEEVEQYKHDAQEVPFENSELKEAHKKRIEIAEKRVEVFDARHDNTGALKGEYLGQELRTRFEEAGPQLNEDHHFERDPQSENLQLLFVSLGELDRINAEGDHHSGDLALTALQERIETTIQEELKDMGAKMLEAYEIFRSGGSKFSIKLEGVSAAVTEKIRRRLDTSLDVSSILPGSEPAPLAASRIGESELIDVFEELPEDEKIAFANDPHYTKVMIGTAFEMLNQLNDKRETESRLDRLVEKIRSGDEEAAKKFYDGFQARALTPMFSETPDTLMPYDEIKKKLTELGALGDGAWADKKAEIALKEARRQFESRRLAQRESERKASEIAAKNFINFQGGISENSARYVKQKESKFTMPKPTTGKQEITRLQDMSEQLEAKLKDKKCPEGGSLDPSCQDMEDVNLDLEKARAERDSMTGLLQRGPLFRSLETALQNNESASTVYIDMAFLKYFDKEGGRDTGNVAIEKAGEILDEVAVKFKAAGKQIEAYRIGGDEFALTVSGEDEAFLKEVLQDLADRQQAAGEVPLQGKAPVGVYADQALEFNYGVFHAKDKDSLKSFLKENGLELEHEGTDKENNELADYMLRFADKQLEIQKAVNRFNLLIQEYVSSEDPAAGKFAQLEKYSMKSIFGVDGAKKIEAWGNRLKEAAPAERVTVMTEMDAEIIAFVIEEVKKKNESDERYEGSLDQIIETHVRDKFLEQKIESLEAEIHKLGAELAEAQRENETLSAENEDLRKRIALLREEKEQIGTLREKIRG